MSNLRMQAMAERQPLRVAEESGSALSPKAGLCLALQIGFNIRGFPI